MALDGVNSTYLNIALSGLTSEENTGSSAEEGVFGNMLMDALSKQGSDVSGGTLLGRSYQNIGELVQNTGSPGAVLAALISAGSGEYSQYALNGIYGSLLGTSYGFGSSAPYGDLITQAAGMPTASPSIPVSANITSDVSNRSARLYSSAINQFIVQYNPRYAVNQKGREDTYCNIFVWDVTSAMNAEIPHYFDKKTGEPLKCGDKDASEMNANAMHDWLKEHGAVYGWHEVTASEAQSFANAGHPVVTAIKRPGSHGHVQVVCPSKDGAYNELKGVTVAQAGSNLTSYSYISDLLGSASLSKVSYFAHA